MCKQVTDRDKCVNKMYVKDHDWLIEYNINVGP